MSVGCVCVCVCVWGGGCLVCSASMLMRAPDLQLTHHSVVHSKKKGGLQNREFTAVRRVHLHPDVAAVLEDADVFLRDPFLIDGVTWRVCGTQTVDGHMLWFPLASRTGLVRWVGGAGIPTVDACGVGVSLGT